MIHTTESNLSYIRDYVLKILPQLLQEEPTVAIAIDRIIAQQLPRRDEFARLLDELKQQREDLHQQLELNTQRFESFQAEVKQQLQLQRQEMEQRLESHQQEVQQRLEALREDMQQRLEALREEMKQRLEALREDMQQRLEALREEMNQRLEALREDMNRRFEQVDKRFEQVDKRFEQVHQDHLELKRRIIKLESGQDQILNRMTGMEAWLKIISGNLGTEKGQTMEDLFAIALRYGLKNPDIKPETILLRQELVDVNGEIFLRKGYSTEVDLIAENGQLTVFEVKAHGEMDDVDWFVMKVELLRRQRPNQTVRGVFISPGAGEKMKQRCIEFGVELLD